MDAELADFVPPHCPNPQCEFHLDAAGWRYKRAGTHERKAPPHVVPRFQCHACRRSFSSQTFSCTYWLKRPELLERVFSAEVGGSGHRQIGRQLEIAHATVQRCVERLGRHFLLAHEQWRAEASRRIGEEPLVMDGLRTFARGQYWVVEITNLIAAKAYHSFDFVVTEKRRSGTMTDRQKRKREEVEARYGKPDPRAPVSDVVELLAAMLPSELSARRKLVLRTDEDKAYRQALQKLAESGIEHQTTPSTAPRIPHNPLFAVNALHELMRHSGAHLKRETIAFAKRIQAIVYRFAIYQYWQNHVKPGTERAPRQSRSQRLGLPCRRRRAAEVIVERLFPTRMELRDRVSDYYFGRVRSRFLANERRHALIYAF